MINAVGVTALIILGGPAIDVILESTCGVIGQRPVRVHQIDGILVEAVRVELTG